MGSLLLALIYICFISLGLPDSLLGSAWPVLHTELGVPVSYAGIISMVIYLGTIISSLFSERLLRRFGSGLVTATSIFITALALLGFSLSHSFVELILWAIPYGLGAGGVDAILNNYVALHYKAQHMSWLHCMWGVGAAAGPYAMEYALTGGQSWNMGYRYISIIQITLTVILFLSLPLWKKQTTDNTGQEEKEAEVKPFSFRQIIKIPGSKEVMIAFFCYCAIEQTAGLWASSYLVINRGLSAETAAGFASLFFIGITAGRAVSGFLTMKLCDTQMIRLGQGIILFGIALLILPLGSTCALVGLILVGLGCAPVYPSIIHSTPEHFGKDKSQAMIGVQMASAYVGTCLMPPIFGLIANHISVSLFPIYLLIILVLMAIMYEKMLSKVTVNKD